MMSIQELQEKYTCLCRKVDLLVKQNRVASPDIDNWPVPKGIGLVIIPTAGANTRDVQLPNPALWKTRRITVVNESGASQNILSHDGGVTATIKSTSGANVGTLAIVNAAAATTAGARFTFYSDGNSWHILGN